MTQVFGSQCTDFQPEVTGFNRNIFYLLVKWLRPIMLVTILVLTNSILTKILAILMVQQVYYLVQL